MSLAKEPIAEWGSEYYYFYKKLDVMIYPIQIFGSPVLRQPTEEISADYPELKQLVEDMYETMYEASGVGLAAPQIGKSIRLVVIDTGVVADEDPEVERFKRVLINPVIYERGGEDVLMTEGCLSVPDIHEEVERPERIRVRYFDEEFNEYDEEYEGYSARVIQHEYDHLEGKLFVDRLMPLRRNLLRNKLNGMAKGKFEANYRTRIARR